TPFTMKPHDPQIPSRQSWSNAIGSLPSCISRSFTTSSISRNDMSGLTPGTSCVSKAPAVSGPDWRHTFSVMRIAALLISQPLLLVGTRRRVDELEVQLLFVQL